MTLRTRAATTGFLLAALALGSCGGTPVAPARVQQQTVTPPPPHPAPPPGVPPNTNPASGVYALTLTLGPECAALPDAEKVRTYTARLDDAGSDKYVVTLSDARFLTGPICTMTESGLDCNQFRAAEDGGGMHFSLNNVDEWHGGYITEQTASGTWVEISGEATGVRAASSMTATGRASVWYCSTRSSYPFPCYAVTSCKTDLKLAFTKK